MQELLLFFACLNNTGCSESLTAYKQYNPEIVAYYESQAKRIEAQVPTVVKNYVAPVATIGLGGAGAFQLHKNYVLKIERTQLSLIYSVSY